MPRLRALVPGLCSLLLLACKADPAADTGGSESESDGGTETGDEELGKCGEVTMSVIDDPLTIPPGFDSTITAMITDADGSYAGTFVWSGAEAPFDVTHAGTESSVALTLAHQGGEIRLTEVELAGEFPDGVLGAPCANTVEIDVSLTLDTDDGLFAESMTVPLRISGFPGQGTGQPNIYHSLDFGAHMGSLALDDFGTSEGAVSDVILGINFTGMEAEGWIGMEVSDGEGPDADVTFGMVATFTAVSSP